MIKPYKKIPNKTLKSLSNAINDTLQINSKSRILSGKSGFTMQGKLISTARNSSFISGGTGGELIPSSMASKFIKDISRHERKQHMNSSSGGIKSYCNTTRGKRNSAAG
jgi:hypothetical protein